MVHERDVDGFEAAVKYVAEFNVPRKTRAEVRAALRDSLARMSASPKTLSTDTLGYTMVRDGEGDIRAWVDPKIWRKAT